MFSFKIFPQKTILSSNGTTLVSTEVLYMKNIFKTLDVYVVLRAI